MSRRISNVIAFALILSVAALAASNGPIPSSLAAPAAASSVGTTLPLTCSGPTAPAPCVYGYVYYGDTPVAGASITIDSQYGTLVVSTSSGGLSADPYFQASLVLLRRFT